MRSRRNCERFPSGEGLAHDDGLAWCFGNSTDSQPKTQGDEDMKSNFIIAAMAALAVSMATMLATIGPANANEAVWEPGCNNSYRVSHRDSSCLHAWWDNTPSISSGVAGGSKVGVKSHCSQYGEIIAHVDIRDYYDYHFVLDNSNRARQNHLSEDVREVSCCMNESDLCYTQQVERRGGPTIWVYTGSGTSMREVDVSSHQKRYEFCQDNADGIYCRVRAMLAPHRVAMREANHGSELRGQPLPVHVAGLRGRVCEERSLRPLLHQP